MGPGEFYDGPFTVTQADLDNGYAASRFLTGAGAELLVGLGTGGLASGASKAGWAGRTAKTALALDTASNALSVGRGTVDAYNNGLGFGNSLQIVGGAFGLAGNYAAGSKALGELATDAGRVRVSFDPATLSSGPVPLGGVKVSLAPRTPTKVSVPQSAVRTNAQLVDDIGTRAGQWAGRSRQQTSLAGLTAREVATQQHSYAKRLLERYQGIYGDRGLSAEVRYFNGKPLLRGRTPKGSIRLDVVEGDIFNPTAIYDYKFGTSGLSTGRINQIRTGAGLSPNIPVIEVRP